MDLAEDRLQPGVRSLLLEHFQRPQQRHAAAQQVGQLAVGDGQQLRPARGARAGRSAAGAASSTSSGKSDRPASAATASRAVGGRDRAGELSGRRWSRAM